MKAWNLKQLKQSLESDLAKCQTKHEILMCKTIGHKEIRALAEQIKKERNLTPGEISILESL